MLPPPPGKKKSGDIYEVVLHEEDPSKALTFINVTLTDTSEAVFKMVHEKISNSQKKMPTPAKFKEKVATRLAKTAANKIPPSAIAKKMAETFPKMLMYKMNTETGMQVAAQTVFVEDCFFVIQIQVQQVDLNRLVQSMGEEKSDDDDDSVAPDVLEAWIEDQKKLAKEEKESNFVTGVVTSSANEKTSEWSDGFLGFVEWLVSRVLPVTVHKVLEEDKLPSLVQAKLSDKMQTMLEKKLADKGMGAEIAVLGHEAQARYFFPQLQHVRGKEGK